MKLIKITANEPLGADDVSDAAVYYTEAFEEPALVRGREFVIRWGYDLDLLKAWFSSELAVFYPHLTPDEREFILTGMTAEDWDATYGEDEE